MITAHQLYNYITDHASTYGMKPLRMSKTALPTDNKKGTPDLHEYALVALWNRYGPDRTHRRTGRASLFYNLLLFLLQFGLLQRSGGLASPR